MTGTIYETTISEDAGKTVVHLHIADAPVDDTRASFRLQILATLPLYKEPLLAHLQRLAMKVAQEELSPLLQRLANEISQHHPLEPEKRKMT